MRITLFEGNRVETFTSLAAAAYAAKTWYSDLENETPVLGLRNPKLRRSLRCH